MVASPKFEISITIVIALNMIIIAVEYFNQPLKTENIINVINTIFVTLYGLETLFKLIGLRLHFFRNAWNIFDLIINILSILCKNVFCLYFLDYREINWDNLFANYKSRFATRRIPQVLHNSAQSPSPNSLVPYKSTAATFQIRQRHPQTLVRVDHLIAGLVQHRNFARFDHVHLLDYRHEFFFKQQAGFHAHWDSELSDIWQIHDYFV